MNKFSRRALHRQLALAGLLGVSTLVLQSQAYAANYGSLNGSSITLSNGDVVTADTLFNNSLNGINNIYGTTASINLGSGSKVIADANGSAARGIQLQGANSVLNASGLEVNVKGGYVFGLDISGSKDRVDLGTGGSISVEGTSGNAISVSSASSLKADGIAINAIGAGGVSVQGQGSSVDLGSGSSITSSGSAIYVFGANGNAADGPAKFTASGLTVDTQGSSAYGANIQKNSIVDLGTGSSITTHGTNSTGVWVHGEFKADAVSITTTGGGDSVALGVRAGGLATVGANSHLRAEKNSTLVATGVGAVANFKGTSTERNTIFSGGSTGASAQLSGTVNLESTDIVVDRNGSTAYAVWAAGGVVNAVNTTVTGANGVYGVVANSSGGKVYFTGETAITMASAGEVAMVSAGSGNLISGIGKMNITGGVYSQDNATTDLKMTQGSVLTGGAFASSGGKTNLSFDGSRWNMSEDSAISKLALNNSTVDFTEDKTGSVLSVGDLSGNGTFVMRINMVDDSADKLVVTGTSAGNHNVQVLNRGSLATTGNEVVTIVETQDGVASFNLLNTSRVVELGGYQYSLRQNNTNWELYASGAAIPVDPTIPAGPDPLEPEEPKISSTGDASANFLNVSYMLNYAETQTLMQRMGELRQTENSQGDVWVRAFTGKFDSFAGGKLSGFDMDYTGAQVGADRKLALADGDIYLGVMGGTTKADSNYKEGNGDVKGYHFGLYGTYVAPNNLYIDGTLKYSHLKTNFNVKDSQYDQITGSASSDGYGLSVEIGKRFYLNTAKVGYYIEPQAQLSYLHQDSSSNTSSNGLLVDLDSYDSTLARASAIFGYEIKEGKNPVNVYVKTGYVTEMSGNVGYRLNGNPEKHDFGGGWWENGVGVTASINKKHNLYLDGTYATGSKFDQMQVNAGYRYSF